MALTPLASTGDLSDRGISISDSVLADTMLAVASATIRQAAGSPIDQQHSTVVLYGWGESFLPLPGLPVQSVDSVLLDGEATTDYTFVGDGLWCAGGWGCASDPVAVTVTMTHGLTEVPADIVDLTCNLAAAGQVEARSLAGGDSFDPRVVAQSLDDYRVQFASGAEAVASIFDLPTGTRSRLRARFGGGVAVVEYR